MDRVQLQELIQADLDGALSATERAELARLLLRDPEARRLHEEFRQTDKLLRDIPKAAPPPGLRAAILAASGGAVRTGNPRQRQSAWPLYRLAAAIVGGLVIVGVSYLLLDADTPRHDLQGSLSAPRDHLSLQADGATVNASLRREGAGLRLELKSSTTIPTEVVATTTNGEVTVPLATGNQAVAVDLSGTAPIQLELRAGGRLLAEGSLSLSDP